MSVSATSTFPRQNISFLDARKTLDCVSYWKLHRILLDRGTPLRTARFCFTAAPHTGSSLSTTHHRAAHDMNGVGQGGVLPPYVNTIFWKISI